MRMSCNGCRILRKGCSDDCTIKPCLDWIKSPNSQANATLFLAKFYGRAGLINLIEAGPTHLRPAIFKSLLYEACGRIVDPVSGSVGLLWSGNWAHCQSAVEAVLRGSPITQNPSSSSSSAASSVAPSPAPPAFHTQIHPLKTYDIRHISKENPGSTSASASVSASDRTNTGRTRFKRSATVRRPRASLGRAHHRDSWLTHNTAATTINNNNAVDDESIFSVETVEGSLMMMNRAATTTPTPTNNLGLVGGLNGQNNENGEVGLELTLGLSAPTNQH